MEHSFSEAGAFKLARLTRLKRNFRNKKRSLSKEIFFYSLEDRSLKRHTFADPVQGTLYM